MAEKSSRDDIDWLVCNGEAGEKSIEQAV